MVGLEDIINEFNSGIYSPEAIRNFLAFAYQNWVRPPRYVVLIGEGTFDYKNYLGNNDNLMPPLLMSTPYGLFASDSLLGDVNNDSIPEIAVGRIPVLTSEELKSVIQKIVSYENMRDTRWKNKVTMAADHPEEDADFESDSDAVAALLPPNYAVKKIYMSKHSIDDAHDMLLNAINSGTFLVNYIGHGNSDQLEQDGLLMSSDVDFMTNKNRLPLLTAMTCDAGNFAFPGDDSLAESLLIKQDGGAIAIWAPTGSSINEQAVILDEEFFRSAFLRKVPILGDVILDAIENAHDAGLSGYILDIYNIIGDPALRLR